MRLKTATPASIKTVVGIKAQSVTPRRVTAVFTDEGIAIQ
jgi:hypothetical protein